MTTFSALLAAAEAFFEADSVFRLGGPAKMAQQKSSSGFLGGCTESLGEIVEYETTKTKSLPMFFFERNIYA